MSLFVVRNGFRGQSFVGVLLEATDEVEALRVAADLLRADNEGTYGPEYWSDLSVHPVVLPYVGEFE